MCVVAVVQLAEWCQRENVATCATPVVVFVPVSELDRKTGSQQLVHA